MKEEPISASGSNRQYIRVTNDQGETYIRVHGTSREENHAFIGMSRHFLKQGLPVPRILSVSDDEMEYTQEDLGNTLLFDYIKKGRLTGVFSEEEKAMLRRVMRLLAHFQVEGARGLDWGLCYPIPCFNRDAVLWDLNYFKYCFLKPTGLEFREDKLELDFQRMADLLLQEEDTSFLYRDFQSRNVMIRAKGEGQEANEIYFIDYQGGRRGPKQYDVASFLWQAKANYPQSLRDELIDEYLDELATLEPVDRQAFKARLQLFVLFRTLQVLGAYGFRGYFEKKPHFIQSIPFAIENLRQWLRLNAEQAADFPYLSELLSQMTELKQFKDAGEKKPLVVRIYSFSYKKGIPNDESGNGGGFVFDCRAVNNPGKYDRYMGLTGLDKPVIEFMENDGEIFPFLEAAERLVDASVKRYMERGFQNLMVSFGCTGGQHRSVYSAEHLGKHLNEKFGVEVRITHREQNLERTLPPRS